jgi:hypothetical protein
VAKAVVNETFILLELCGYAALWWCPVCWSTDDRNTVGLSVCLQGSVYPFMKTCIVFRVAWVFLRGTKFILLEGVFLDIIVLCGLWCG